jgi:hypothetical protein
MVVDASVLKIREGKAPEFVQRIRELEFAPEQVLEQLSNAVRVHLRWM